MIEKLDYLAWAFPIVYVKKIRIYAVFSTGLNDCLKYHSYPLLTSEDIFSKLNGGKIFSKIDFSEAYLQVKIDEECPKYLTIHMHQGLYALRRLSFGLKVTPSLFQQIMDATLAGLDYAMAYLLGWQSDKKRKYSTT